MMRRVDLLPAAYVERRRTRRNVGLVVVVALFLLLLLIGWWLLLSSQITDRRNDLADVQQRNQQLQAQIDELQQFAELDAEVRAKRQALEQVMAGDVAWPSVLTELAMVIPAETWLLDLQASAGQTAGAAPVGTETAPVRISGEVPFGRITFTGRTLSMPGVAKWLIRLGGVEEFEAVWLNDATKTEATATLPEIVNFNNTIELNENAASGRFQGGDLE